MSYHEPALLVIETKTGYVRRFVARKRDEMLWQAKPEEFGELARGEFERLRIFGRRNNSETQTS